MRAQLKIRGCNVITLCLFLSVMTLHLIIFYVWVLQINDIFCFCFKIFVLSDSSRTGNLHRKWFPVFKLIRKTVEVTCFKAETLSLSPCRWNLAIHWCGYQGLPLCRWERVAEIAEAHEIAELLSKNFRVGPSKVLINTYCTPCFMISHGRTIRVRKWSWALGKRLGKKLFSTRQVLSRESTFLRKLNRFLISCHREPIRLKKKLLRALKFA